MSKRILICLFSSVALATGCDSGDSSVGGLTSCSADAPCGDSGKVCVNNVCIDRCTSESCPAGKYCMADGLCADFAVEGQACSDEIPCAANLNCADGVCTSKNTPPLETCNVSGNCSDNGICINSVCVARCTETSCQNGQLCASTGLCVDGAQLGEKCSDASPCLANLSCVGGVCKEKPCSDSNPCTGDDQYCLDGVCILKCHDETNPCAGRFVCDGEGRCVEPCHTGRCPEGMVCGSPKRVCIPGECSWYDDCADDSKICDLETNRCLDRCSQGTCGDGKVCGDDQRCFVGECSNVDPCANSEEVCNTDEAKCIAKCHDNGDCPDGKLCYADGLCRVACSRGTCGKGTVCGSDGICVDAECSDIDPCGISYKVCDGGVCVDKCKENADCGEGKYCDTLSGLCMTSCTADSCGEGMVCGESGFCVKGECSIVEPCGGGLVCTATHECVTETFDSNECYFAADCTDRCDCDAKCSAENATPAQGESLEDAIAKCKTSCEADCKKCESRNKPCPEGKQCNSLNQCIDKKDRKGLGEPCQLDKECDEDLMCVTGVDPKKGYCKSKAYAEDRKPCVVGTYRDHCAGNVIVECVDGFVQVQDCKTYYQDYTAASLANFYGDDFTCVKRPRSNFVMCAKKCDGSKLQDEWFVCGWDPDDPEIDFSDRYVCTYNEDGRAAYFPSDSRYCSPTCDPSTGKCE